MLLVFCRLELLLWGHNLSYIIHKRHKCHPNHIFIQMDHRWDFTCNIAFVTLNIDTSESYLILLSIYLQYGQLLGHPRQVLYMPSYLPVRTHVLLIIFSFYSFCLFFIRKMFLVNFRFPLLWFKEDLTCICFSFMHHCVAVFNIVTKT